MSKPIQTLIIEDHQLIIDSYTRALAYISSKSNNYKFIINTAKNCNDAIIEIDHIQKNRSFDLVFLDISLPPCKQNQILSGDDLGLKLRQAFPNVKIIVSTHLNDNYRLLNILKNIKPDSLLLKSELSFQNLTESIVNVLNDIPSYSNPILKLIRQQICNDYNLDQIDRQMLYHLSQGAKTKDLTEIVHLSLAGVERRKRKLNHIFNNDKKTDKELLKLAKAKGFL